MVAAIRHVEMTGARVQHHRPTIRQLARVVALPTKLADELPVRHPKHAQAVVVVVGNVEQLIGRVDGQATRVGQLPVARTRGAETAT